MSNINTKLQRKIELTQTFELLTILFYGLYTFKLFLTFRISKMKYLFLLTAILINLSNWTNAAPLASQKGGNCYTVDIPDYMTRTYNLNDVATLQFQNVTKEAYTIVIDDSKEQLQSVGMKFVNPKEFLESFTSTYMPDVTNRQLSGSTDFVVNGNSHSQSELTWTNDGIDFYMLITAVETPNNFYKILSWTLREFKDTLKPDYIKISKSLKD